MLLDHYFEMNYGRLIVISLFTLLLLFFITYSDLVYSSITKVLGEDPWMQVSLCIILDVVHILPQAKILSRYHQNYQVFWKFLIFLEVYLILKAYKFDILDSVERYTEIDVHKNYTKRKINNSIITILFSFHKPST